MSRWLPLRSEVCSARAVADAKLAGLPAMELWERSFLQERHPAAVFKQLVGEDWITPRPHLERLKH